jgi:hypothetical protein
LHKVPEQQSQESYKPLIDKFSKRTEGFSSSEETPNPDIGFVIDQ